MAEERSRGESWGAPLARLDSAWQTLEGRLCAAVLVTEIVSLFLWIVLKGLATDYIPGTSSSGVVLRSVLLASIFGMIANAGTRRFGTRTQRYSIAGAIIVGLVDGRFLAHTGVLYFGNLLNWLQNASVLMLIGGLRGLATRLTLWVALLGASLATSRGKHINVDVLLRYIPAKLRLAGAIAGWLAAATVCICGVVGFVDYIAIAEYRATAVKTCPDDSTRSCDTSAGEKLATVLHETSSDFFLLGRQASLDLRSLPRVIVGVPYDTYFSAADWNTWLDGSDWSAHFDKDSMASLRADPASSPTRMPAVIVPGTGEEVRGLLVRELNFVFPFGLGVIAIKFLLRILLAIAGFVNIDPDAAHAEESFTKATDENEVLS